MSAADEMSPVPDGMVIIGRCDDCRRPAVTLTAPVLLGAAIRAAARYDLMPVPLTGPDAQHAARQRPCRCYAGKLARRDLAQNGPSPAAVRGV